MLFMCAYEYGQRESSMSQFDMLFSKVAIFLLFASATQTRHRYNSCRRSDTTIIDFPLCNLKFESTKWKQKKTWTTAAMMLYSYIIFLQQGTQRSRHIPKDHIRSFLMILKCDLSWTKPYKYWHINIIWFTNHKPLRRRGEPFCFFIIFSWIHLKQHLNLLTFNDDWRQSHFWLWFPWRWVHLFFPECRFKVALFFS